jgi:hypothetical protein
VADPSKDKLREYLRWVAALQRSMEVALQGESRTNVWKYGGYKQFARKYDQILSEVAANVQLPPIFDRYNLDKIPGGGDTIAFQQKEIFEGVHANVSLLRSFLEGKIGIVEDETAALRDFFQAKLRSTIFRPPEVERDVQDAVEQLLIGRGLQKGQDYDREVGRVKVSAKEVVPGLVVHKLSLASEVKLVKTAARVREVVDEINADITAYSKGYRSLLFIVYDLGYIRDEVEFRHDLESSGNVAVLVVKQ